MKLNYRCGCGGMFRPKASKVAILIGHKALTLLGAAINPQAMAAQHHRMSYVSHRLGTFLICHGCGREVPLSELVE